MRIFLCALLLACPAFAAKVIVTCNDGLVNLNADGSYSINCSVDVPPPPPPPPPPSPGTCPAVPGLQMHGSFGNPGVGIIFSTEVGVVNSWPLPKAAIGLIGSTATPSGPTPTPAALWMEWTISKCPGDTGYYKTAAAATVTPRGSTIYPCGEENGQESGGISWSLPGGDAGHCKVPAGEQWYVNLRFLRGVGPTGRASIVYFWQGK